MSGKHIKALALTLFTSSFVVGCSTGELPFNTFNPALRNPNLQTFNSPSAGSTSTGQIIVKYRAGGASAQMFSATFSQLGLQRVRPIGSANSGMEVLQLHAGQSTAQTLQTLSQNPAILYAEEVFTIPFPKVTRSAMPAFLAEPATFPNDPMFPKQYSHNITHSQDGWKINQGTDKVVLGIVDSGVDVTHPDLKGKIIGTHNSADGNDEVVDHVGHGTHVSGIAAASTNNGIGVAGVCGNCKILAVKVAPGESTAPTTAGIADGILWAADHGANVINLSLGSNRESKAITDAVNQALAKNVVVVVAMGNDGGHVKSWPAAVPGVIAVGSTDNQDKRSSFSNFGEWISVGAPGSNILSTFPLNDNMIGQKEYGMISGTSMATPFVTGLAGLVRSQNSSLSVADVKKAIQNGADDLGTSGFDNEFGTGRVNVGKTLQALAGLQRR